MKKYEPEVSVIMPVYNSQKTLPRAFHSVQNQSLENWQLIAVDDASSDQSWDILKTVSASDPRIKITQLAQNSGPGAARNQAISQAQGRYLAFLDADDEWHKDKLDIQLSWMKAHNIAFSCTAYERVRQDRLLKTTHVPKRVTKEQLLRNNTVGTLTAIYDREIIGDVRFLDIRRRQDYAFWLELLTRTPYVYGLDQVLARYHQGHASLSSNKLRAAWYQWKFYSDVLDMSLPKRVSYFSSYAINASKRYF